jgi:hypothetical protein
MQLLCYCSHTSSDALQLGAGTALPTCAVFQSYLKREGTLEPLHFTLADYNLDVLRLVTIPNLLLTWVYCTVAAAEGESWNAESDLDVTEDLLEEFLLDLTKRHISIDAISGGWGPQFETLLSTTCRPSTRLVLASETIYSPATLVPFTRVLMGSLKGVQMTRALVAAKRMYFGLGGGINEFVSEVEKLGGKVVEVAEETSAGVSRAILEVLDQ